MRLTSISATAGVSALVLAASLAGQQSDAPARIPAVSAQISALMGPGISRELAEYRAARIGNVRYDLALDVT
ncbi:MAG: hypothetical protein ABI328_04760, partial [Gemmatimonadaceae bacterium]